MTASDWLAVRKAAESMDRNEGAHQWEERLRRAKKEARYIG
jgi:hypothetical protein